MKKIVFAMFLGLIGAGLVGCSAKSRPQDPPPPTIEIFNKTPNPAPDSNETPAVTTPPSETPPTEPVVVVTPTPSDSPQPVEGTQPDLADLCAKALEKAQKNIDGMVADFNSNPSKANFFTTVYRLDNAFGDLNDALSPLGFMSYVSTDPKEAEAGAECEAKQTDFFITAMARRDIYDAIKNIKASGLAQTRLLDDYKRGFEKNGMSLTDEGLKELTALKAKLAKLESEFSNNLNTDKTTVLYKVEELKGLTQAQIDAFKTDENGMKIVTTKGPDYQKVMMNVVIPESRKKMLTAYWNRAPQNTELLEQAVLLRQEIAKILKYETWADHQTAGRMAGTGAAVKERLTSLKEKLVLKNKSDVERMLKAKKEMEDANATELSAWDILYFENQIKKKDFELDDATIRAYFPKDTVMKGMFEVYSILLGVTFEEVQNPKVWHESVKQYAVRDGATNNIVAYFYADLFPREGKYGHAAAFPLLSGRVLPDGKYSIPVASIVANMAPPTGDMPSLLSHDEVETIFHEFGHIMHQILTRAPYSGLSGTSVARDYVEAPSQMLEGWVYDSEILKMISGHYKTGEALPEDLLKKIIAAQDFNKGYYYTRQLMLGTFDYAIHSTKGAVKVNDVYNKLYEEMIGVKPIEGANFPAGFGHMMGGYDAGYYGYIWSEVYAADMFSEFQKGGLLNANLGMKYRTTILEQGGMVDPLKLVEMFLGRASNNDAFYKKLGI